MEEVRVPGEKEPRSDSVPMLHGRHKLTLTVLDVRGYLTVLGDTKQGQVGDAECAHAVRQRGNRRW